MKMTRSGNVLFTASRLSVGAVFVASVGFKLFLPAGFSGALHGSWMGAAEPAIYWLVVALETCAAVCLLANFRVFQAALVLAAILFVAAFSFNWHPKDSDQRVHFVEKIAIAGALLGLAAADPGRRKVASLPA